MKLTPILWMIASITFESAGDVFAKMGVKSPLMMLPALLSYNATMIAWLMVVKSDGRLGIPGTIWCLSGQAALVLIGIIGFNEAVSGTQVIGALFALIAVTLLCL